MAIILIAIAAVGLAAWWNNARRASPTVVVPNHIKEIDPQIRAHLEDHIRWLRESPVDATRHAVLGQAYYANGLWAEAHDCFQNVLQLAPNHMQAAYYAALSTLQIGERELAKTKIRDVINGDSEFAPAFDRFGVMCLEDGAIDDAASAFQQAIKLAPRQPAGYIGLADVMNRRKDFNRAVELLNEAFVLETRDKTAYYLLGLAYRGLGEMERAKAALEKGKSAERQFMPDSWTPQIDNHRKGVAFQLSHAHWLIGNQRTQDAIELLESALAWHPDNVEILNNLAISRMEVKEFDKARDHLLKAEALGGNAMATSINLAACFLELGDLSQAEAYAETAVRLGPGVAQPYVTLASVLMRTQRWGEAAAALEQSLEINDGNPAVHYDLGNLYLQLNRAAEARLAFSTAAKGNPHSPLPYLRLCEACIRTGEREEAATALERARQLAPDHELVAALTRRLEQNP